MTTSAKPVVSLPMDLLAINQSPYELADIYGCQDYYWYLRSPEFVEAFLKPMGELITQLGGPCLDAGCGEGQLSPYIDVRYWGFDGSRSAIIKADHNYTSATPPGKHFCEGRLEYPPHIINELFTTVVFAGILEVLVKPEHRLSFLRMYQYKYNPTYFVICDLECLDISPLQQHYKLIHELHADAKLAGIPDVKNKRQILVFQCH